LYATTRWRHCLAARAPGVAFVTQFAARWPFAFISVVLLAYVLPL
jgi:hypothetical protein